MLYPAKEFDHVIGGETLVNHEQGVPSVCVEMPFILVQALGTPVFISTVTITIIISMYWILTIPHNHDVYVTYHSPYHY